MAEQKNRPSIVRIIAAILLGFFIGFAMFFLVVLIIGAINDMLGVQIPVTMQFAANIFSAITLTVLIVVCIAGFLWIVWRTPPLETEEPTELVNPPT